MDAFLRRFRVVAKPEARGLSCGPDGLSLAGVALLRKTADGFDLRPSVEMGALMLAAYGELGNQETLARGLRATAGALNRGEGELAMIAAVHLRLGDLDSDAVARIAAVDAFLAKYDPNEPRDERGRWTTGGANAGGSQSGASALRAQTSVKPRPKQGPRAESSWDGVSHPSGGRLILTGGEEEDYGSNERPEWRPIVEPPAPLGAPQVPPGWDENIDGRIERRPKLRDGRLWPPAPPNVVVETLKREQGSPPPKMWIFTPEDGKGPPLVGSTGAQEYDVPPGYEKVELIGMPQETRRRGERTNHAIESADAALQMAMTNRYSRIYFNSALSTSTDGEVDAALRPDVLGVVRPELDLGYRFKPYEIYSPGQASEPRETLLQLLHPAMGEAEGRYYKFLLVLWNKIIRTFYGRLDGGNSTSEHVPYSFLTSGRNLLKSLGRSRQRRGQGDQ
jgi:hypothetical protein